jgi:large subunit ribosomal protein L15
VDVIALAAAGLVRSVSVPVKVLGTGELAVALKLRVAAVSDSARKKIEAAGGSVEILAS